jgi:hypothetical protein
MDIQAIAGILKQEISPYEARLDMVKVGRVLQVGDGIARIHGLDPTDIPAPQGDRPYRPDDPDGGESLEDGHLGAAFDDSRRDGVAGEPCGVV